MKTTTIVLADTHELFAQGLRHLLEARPYTTVIEVVTDGFAALGSCRQNSPSLLLIDSTIAGLDALEVARQLHRFSSPTKVLLMLPFRQVEVMVQAKRCGAAGVVQKTAGLDELYSAIDVVLAGNKRFPAELLVPTQGALGSDQGEPISPYSKLTARERTIFKYLVEGHSIKFIAGKLELESKTVDVHKTNLMRKLEVNDRNELIQFAIRQGLMDQ